MSFTQDWGGNSFTPTGVGKTRQVHSRVEGKHTHGRFLAIKSRQYTKGWLRAKYPGIYGETYKYLANKKEQRKSDGLREADQTIEEKQRK
jgi:hypothetical protein